jgi:hypothetical protein
MDLNDLTTTYGPLVLKVLPACLVLYIGYNTYASIYRQTGLNSLQGPENDSFALGHLSTIRGNEPGALYKRWVNQYGHVMRFFGPMRVDFIFTLNKSSLC